MPRSWIDPAVPSFDMIGEARLLRASSQPSAELVSMPWTALHEPSLGLGLLSAVLAQEGLSARVRHNNLMLLRYLQVETYKALADSFALNDFLFTGLLDPTLSTRQWGWLRHKAAQLAYSGRVRDPDGQPVKADQMVDRLLHLRRADIPELLAEQAAALVASPAPLVGFTCMFDQTISSIALAQLVKESAHDKLVALGGYAVRPPTAEAIIRAFPWIDAVCTGEGEATIVALTRAAVGDRSLAGVPGIVYRQPGSNTPTATGCGPVVNLTHSPPPDYDDFYLDLAELADTERIDVRATRLPVENSRGCWWGQIRHCVFCGIHDEDLAYRVKPPEVALRTMDVLSERYNVHAFRFSDYILPRSYFTTLLPELARRGAPYRLTAEMKANVHESDVASLATAGFIEVQPGIESFSTKALASMDKGTSAAQNAQTLLLGKAAGLQVHWNLLYGFPDDDEDDYEQMLETLSRLVHLDPPASRLPVQITRYAPLQADPGRFGLSVAVHEPSYDLVFSADFLSRTGFDLESYCYYFLRPFENPVALRRIYRRLDALVDRWAAAAAQRDVTLQWRLVAGQLVVTDSRTDPGGVTYVLDEPEASVLLALARPRSLTGLARAGLAAESHLVRQALARLDDLRLVIRDGERWLSVVLPAESRLRTPVTDQSHFETGWPLQREFATAPQ